MRSKLLSFLLVLACAALIGLHPVRAQNPTGSSDANGNAVAAPAKQSDTASPSSVRKSEQAVPDSKRDADNAIANDRGTATGPAHRLTASVEMLSLIALVGLIGLVLFLRRRSAQTPRDAGLPRRADHEDHRRAA